MEVALNKKPFPKIKEFVYTLCSVKMLAWLKLPPLQAMTTYIGRRGRTPFILNLSTRLR